MNYLGHLYFSNDDFELMQANLFGDFVKGKDLSYFPAKIQQGIILHRNIDHFIDTHPKVLELLHFLYPNLPKVSGIAVDLFFDHLLAKHWVDFHSKAYLTFIEEFYEHIDSSTQFYTPDFQLMLLRMKQMNWLKYYPTLDGLEKACQGLSKRLSFPNHLTTAPTIFVKNESYIRSVFEEYMVDAIREFKHSSFFS